jgi:hypothetical protein
MVALAVRERIAVLSAAQPKPRPVKPKPGVVINLLPAQVAEVKAGAGRVILTVGQLDAVHAQQGNLLSMVYGPDGHLRYPLS